ncbi:RICIN domain-containing protein [Streptomyces turgidiscabies]|uniref:Ricin B lectin domain-containing protein n=1 Tax=Streptomyces turgidiscabies TaxID=85558 RepID=A0ABU0RG03_9ACTN|nr:RICIN domain-containing protein [Streptomyces turgidiscabies]MDQ0930926.1 hypothetical protein [Streptomyces turgidiscabies]
MGLADKCLDVQSGATAAGTPVQLYDCNGTKAQKFRIDARAGSSDPSTVTLKVLGERVVPSGGGTANGTAEVLADFDGGTGQKWTTVSAGHKLKHVSSGKCLDVPSLDSASGTNLQLYT